MPYKLLSDLISKVKEYEKSISPQDISLSSFSSWLYEHESRPIKEIDWDGKSDGRSIDSIINTLFVHMYRYAQIRSKEVISESSFSTIDEFIYLINLKNRGAMSKTNLIRLSIHEKSSGIQIINRLIRNGWVSQKQDIEDRRSMIVTITKIGEEVLEERMSAIRIATKEVAGDLTEDEKIHLVELLQKLERYHIGSYKLV